MANKPALIERREALEIIRNGKRQLWKRIEKNRSLQMEFRYMCAVPALEDRLEGYMFGYSLLRKAETEIKRLEKGGK